ncbi:hypothetical protein DPMN_014935 [Dreissena polymorpha]|uniref:Uncharacterized protein n=1 Tax=Dreissena polymorpha TaxID=45954 RepID=A0A9D4NAN3_DREPO|nr:hypothetical protein DPMN_014935 [Dreissena polymorpha]
MALLCSPERKKTAPSTCGHVFSPIWTISELGRYINLSNVSPSFMMIGQKCINIRKCATSPPGSHKLNGLTKFHEHRTKNVTSRVFTCFHYIHIEKTAPPNGGHVFSPI